MDKERVLLEEKGNLAERIKRYREWAKPSVLSEREVKRFDEFILALSDGLLYAAKTSHKALNDKFFQENYLSAILMRCLATHIYEQIGEGPDVTIETIEDDLFAHIKGIKEEIVRRKEQPNE